MHNAGLEANMLVEIDKLAAQTLRTNRPNWNVIANDITKVDFTGLKPILLLVVFHAKHLVMLVKEWVVMIFEEHYFLNMQEP